MSRLMSYSFSSDWKQHPLVSRDATVYKSGDAVAVISGTTIHLFCICYFLCFLAHLDRLSKPDSSFTLP